MSNPTLHIIKGRTQNIDDEFHNLLRMTLLSIIYRLNKRNEIVKLVTKTVNIARAM